MGLKSRFFRFSSPAAALMMIIGGQAYGADLDVEPAMVEAATFFGNKLAVEGSYVWTYDAANLAQRRGEGITTLHQGWSEPPGSPAIGLAYLAAYKATGRKLFLDLAKTAARALLRTQLESGGWQGRLEFDPAARRAWCYRVDAGEGRPDCDAINGNKLKNATSLDDNISQAPLTFLIRLDAELKGEMRAVRQAVIYGLARLLRAQYPNGAWPFRLDLKIPNERTQSAWRARHPEDWSRTFVKPEGEVYVLNDHLIRDTIRLFLLAHAVYGEPVYRAAAMRGGDFLLSSQMPEPQPGWAQIYDADLIPVWGRRFEPPAIASRETAGAIEALDDLHIATGKTRYRDAIGPAIRWLERSRLPHGGWARFYELGANQPLYIDPDYRLTYRDESLPDHYRFKGPFGIPSVLAQHHGQANAHDRTSMATDTAPVPKEADVMAIVNALDDHGRWTEDGLIQSGIFARNLATLAAFAAARKGESLPDYLGPIDHQLDR